MRKRNSKLYFYTAIAVIFIIFFIVIFFIFSQDVSYNGKDGTISIPESDEDERQADNGLNHTDSTTESPKKGNQSDDDSVSMNQPSDNISSDEMTSDDMASNDITSDDMASDKMTSDHMEKNLSEGDNSMEHPDRVTYRAGFYFEPITEDIKNRIYGLSYKEDCTVPYDDLRYVSVLYKNFKGETDYGEIICNKAIAQDLVEIFYELFENDYPIEKIRLIDEYNADDDLSCLDNNTSCFNYRVVYGSDTLSKHALGMAIDINPFYNPYVTYPDGVERISPPGSEPYADRDADLPYMIQKDDLCYNLFIERGFTWGGEWKTLKDYQHFQKVID